MSQNQSLVTDQSLSTAHDTRWRACRALLTMLDGEHVEHCSRCSTASMSSTAHDTRRRVCGVISHHLYKYARCAYLGASCSINSLLLNYLILGLSGYCDFPVSTSLARCSSSWDEPLGQCPSEDFVSLSSRSPSKPLHTRLPPAHYIETNP